MSIQKRFLSNQLIMAAYALLEKRRLLIGMGSIKKRDPMPVEKFPRERVVLPGSVEWQVLVLALERLSSVVKIIWGERKGEREVEVLANWLSQIHYIVLYDWDAAKREDCLGKLFDSSHQPILHLGVYDEKSMRHVDPDTASSNLVKMARVIFHELFHIAAPLHSDIDRTEYERIYLTYYLTDQDGGLSRLAFEDGELLAWVNEFTTFGEVAVHH